MCLSLGYASWRDEIVKSANRINAIESAFMVDGKDVYAGKSLDQVDTEIFADALEKLIDIWIEFWNEAGGIKKVLEKA